jgi:hypothetical protein
MAVGKALRKIGGSSHLLRGNPPAQDRSADVKVSGLLLRVNADVVAV